MRICQCPKPRPDPNPRRASSCVACGSHFDPAWESNDETVAEFFDRYERALPTWPHVPESVRTFRIHCEARERAGRKTFGMAYLDRDNLREGLEEASDLALYVFLDLLKERRAGNLPHYETDVAMQLVHHAAESYRLLHVMTAKRHGAP
ncbi:MAG: hypothetical protein H0U55_16755 [Rubrobacteraceae bacterium]|nr:hypothetical protein [Rubrobacteraceae bacterium]